MSIFLPESERYVNIISCSKNIFLEFTSNINPCILKPENDDKYIYLLLPVRISVV